MAKAKEKTEDLFPQKRIPAIESAQLAADEKRAEIEAQQVIVDGLAEELKPLEAELREVMHKYEGQIDQQKSEKGELQLIYRRGDYDVVVKSHERLTYGKIRQAPAAEDES